MKAKKTKETRTVYPCPACGSTSFIQEGMANFKENVTIYEGSSGTVIEGSSPDLDIITETTKCTQCGKAY
jgi:Zn finger protein HypA/HybF involved in hydrogenase expression